MKKQTLILIVIVIFSSFLLLTVSQKQKQPTTNKPNLNANNQLGTVDKHYCQTDSDCVLTGSDPDGFATCTNKKWYEKWISNPLSKYHVWACILSEEEQCGCVNNKCQRMDSSKSCGTEAFLPLPNRVSLKMSKGLFTQQEDIVAEVYNTLDKEIGFDSSQVNPFTTLQFEKLANNEADGFEIYSESHCNAPTIISMDYERTRNWPTILKPNESYKIIWPQKNIEGCGNVDSTLEEGHYQMILKYCYPKTDECFNIYSDEFSVISPDFFADRQATQTQKEITLTTDKIQYQSNEDIKITLKNNLTEGIFTLPDWAIQEKLPDNSWLTIYQPPRLKQLVTPTLQEDYTKINTGKTYELKLIWEIWQNQPIIGPGIYRVQLKYLYLSPEKASRYGYPDNSLIIIPEQDLTIIHSNEFAILSGQQTGEKCRSYTRNGISEMYCTVCDDGICEPYEKCVASSCSNGICTSDCGPLYCPQDCTNNKEITLKVDKDNYLQGKEVKITLTNNSDKTIWIPQNCGLPWWNLEEYNSRENIGKRVEMEKCVFCEISPSPIKIMPFSSVQGFVSPPPTQTQKNGILEDVWNTDLGCGFVDEMKKYAETGGYRLVIDYYYDCSENVTKYPDYQYLSKICKGKDKKIYSNEFRIIGPLY